MLREQVRLQGNIAAGIMKNILLSLVFSTVIVNIHYSLNKIDLQIS
jgi:hypothetical protein